MRSLIGGAAMIASANSISRLRTILWPWKSIQRARIRTLNEFYFIILVFYFICSFLNFFC